MNGFHFPADDREERLGKRKFGADWEGQQTETDLDLLSLFCDPLDVYSPLEPHDYPPTPIKGWIYRGSQGKYPAASDARLRALTRQWQLAEVRQLLQLFDKYGTSAKIPPEFEPLKPWEDRAKLAEARRLVNMQSDSVIAEPKIAPTDESRDLKPSAPKITGKRGPKSTVSRRVESEMVADVIKGRLTRIQLNGLLEKEMEDRYGASRDTCRSARVEALKKIKKLRQSSRAAAAKPRNSDK
jgi:hypothetical protein